jgi:cytochrome c peroxidase
MKPALLAAVVLAGTLGTLPSHAGPTQTAVLETYAAQAKAAEPGFAGFSVERGKALFLGRFTTGKPDTPSCTTCHTTDPRKEGQTRAGKVIGPMALSAKPDRYGVLAEAEKWFARNCDSVLGRACTPREKGDFISFMVSQ